MTDLIKIAVDAMGGDNSPNKTIEGIILNHKSNKNLFYRIFGDENKINTLINNKIDKDFFEIIHTTDKLKVLTAHLKELKEEKRLVCGLQLKVLRIKRPIS